LLNGVRDNPDFKYKGVNCNSNEKSYMPTYEFGDKAYGFFVGTLTDMNHELGKVFSFRVSGEKSMVEAIVTHQNENFDTIDRTVEVDTTADVGIITIKKDEIISDSPRVGYGIAECICPNMESYWVGIFMDQNVVGDITGNSSSGGTCKCPDGQTLQISDHGSEFSDWKGCENGYFTKIPFTATKQDWEIREIKCRSSSFGGERNIACDNGTPGLPQEDKFNSNTIKLGQAAKNFLLRLQSSRAKPKISP
jgi:hypothetical protein